MALLSAYKPLRIYSLNPSTAVDKGVLAEQYTAAVVMILTLFVWRLDSTSWNMAGTPKAVNVMEYTV